MKSPYVTASGFGRLQGELDGLWRRRQDVTRALAAAAAEGDRSENAEYIYRKKELRELDRRIRYLQKRLPELTVVREAPPRQDRVYFGAWVTVEDEAGTEHTWRLVGPDELGHDRRHVSIDAPAARALLRRGRDEEVAVRTPAGERRYTVVEIRYAPEA